jgi:hypothetical protein
MMEMSMNEHRSEQPQYWIAVLCRDLAERARAGGYAELSQGRAGILELLHAGDGYITYSPRTADPKGEPLQAFTALGFVRDGKLYRESASDGSQAFRLAVDYVATRPAPVKPMLEELTFIRNRRYWGAAFRFGALRIGGPDFTRIATAMGYAPEQTREHAA